MKKRMVLFAILIASCLLVSACSLDMLRGSGKRVTESRQVRGIDRISLSGSGDVILTQGDGETLTVETDDNLMQYIITEVRGGTLTLGAKEGVNISPTYLRFTLTVVDLDGVAVSGSGNFDAERFNTDSLDIEVSGSGNVRIATLDAQDVQVDISGSGSADLAGQVTGQQIDVSGSGTYRGGDLRSETVSVEISGSGDATVWATDALDARVTGSGSVRYYGSPTTNVSDSGSGTVRELGDK